MEALLSLAASVVGDLSPHWEALVAHNALDRKRRGHAPAAQIWRGGGQCKSCAAAFHKVVGQSPRFCMVCGTPQ